MPLQRGGLTAPCRSIGAGLYFVILLSYSCDKTEHPFHFFDRIADTNGFHE